MISKPSYHLWVGKGDKYIFFFYFASKEYNGSILCYTRYKIQMNSWSFKILLYKPVENVKNRNSEFFFIMECILKTQKITIIAFEQDLVSIWAHYRYHLAGKTYKTAINGIKYTWEAKRWSWRPQMLLKFCLNAKVVYSRLVRIHFL